MKKEKKIYFPPVAVAILMSTADVMHASQPSDTPTPPGAPARRTDVF